MGGFQRETEAPGSEGCISEAVFLQSRSLPGGFHRATPIMLSQEPGSWLGGLACCDSLGGKESDTTERLN